MDWRESMLRGRSEDELREREDIGIVIGIVDVCVVRFGFWWRVCVAMPFVSPHLAAGIS